MHLSAVEWLLVICAVVGIPYCFFPAACRLFYRLRWKKAAKSAHGAVLPEWIRRERYSREGDRVA